MHSQPRRNFSELTFFHDMTGRKRAGATHSLLDEEKLDFFRCDGFGRWLGMVVLQTSVLLKTLVLFKDRVEAVLEDLPEGEAFSSEFCKNLQKIPVSWWDTLYTRICTKINFRNHGQYDIVNVDASVCTDTYH